MSDHASEPLSPLLEDERRVQEAVLAPMIAQVETAFESCGRSGKKPLRYYYRIGNIPVCLSFWGSSLIPIITPALQHLLAEKTLRPELTIHLWDGATAGGNFPVVEKASRAPSVQADSWVGVTNGCNMFFQPSIGILSLVDNKIDQAFFWVRNATSIPYYESGAPLRWILHWWMGLHGYQLLHAGSVGTREGGVLLVGKGGSGKSTTALACLSSGLLYAADDYCMVATQPVPYVHSIFSSGKLNAEDIGRFPEFNPALSNQHLLETEKALYFFSELFPKQVTRGFPLYAILIPEVTNRTDTSIENVSAATSYRALGPSTLLQMPDRKISPHSLIGGLVKRIPSFRLQLGRDMRKTPFVIRDLITTLSSN